MTEEQSKKTYERALKMEQEFGEYFTGEFIYLLCFRKESYEMMFIGVVQIVNKNTLLTFLRKNMFLQKNLCLCYVFKSSVCM